MRPFSLMTIIVAAIACGCAPAVRVERIGYRGWAGAYRVSNDKCELIVVPQISRVMHFSLRGRKNVLWVNPDLAGKVLPEGKEWNNYGGEKVWPTQQSLFPTLAGRAWPPPWPWDGGESKVERIDGGVRITTGHDPKFGAHLVREFVMDRREARVTVRQWIDKTEGEPVPMTIWSVCQVDDPSVAITAAGKRLADGKRYRALGEASPLMLEHETVVTLGRDAKRGLKIGVSSEGKTGWVAAEFSGAMLVISHPRVEGTAYPDQGCDAEIYTSPGNGVKYTELELLSPLVSVRDGERLMEEQEWNLLPVGKGTEGNVEGIARRAREVAGR
jgi:hypothetical protein